MSDNFQDEYEVELKRLAKGVVDEISETAHKIVNKRREKLYKQEGEFVQNLEVRQSEEAIRKPVLVVVTTPKTLEHYKDSEEYRALDKIIYDNTYIKNSEAHYGVELEIIAENTTGLPEVYNKFMNTDYSGYIVTFIHDDVTVYDNHLYEKLIESHKNFEVVGLAGATSIQLPFKINESTAWHKLSCETQGKNVIKHQSGYVAHEHQGKEWSTFFGMVPQQVKIIDGLFMSFDVDSCITKGFEFDTDFKFHHYDITASLRALECGMKITTTGIMVKHKGIGEMDASWVESHRQFVKKYENFEG